MPSWLPRTGAIGPGRFRPDGAAGRLEGNRLHRAVMVGYAEVWLSGLEAVRSRAVSAFSRLFRPLLDLAEGKEPAVEHDWRQGP